MEQYSFVKSQMDKEKLVFNGYIYRHQRSRNNNHYFRYEDKTCNGSATLRGVTLFNANGGSVSEGKAHNHPQIAGRMEVIDALTELKTRAKIANLTPAAIVQEVRQTVNISDSIEMPSTTAMKQVVRRTRKKELPSEPDCATHLVIPDSLKITRSGERNFLLFDSKDAGYVNEEEEDNIRIIGFGSDDSLKKLANSEVWFLDGTFKTCPQLFHQIYTMHYMFHGQTFPAVYVLLSGKTQVVYASMLELLISAADVQDIHLNPKFIIVDFELASINALQQKFPDAKVTGCFFHLAQNIYRSIQKNGLVNLYKTNEDVALSIRKLSALAFLPPEEICDAFSYLLTCAPIQAEPVYKYFGDTFVLGRSIAARGRGRPVHRLQRHPPRFPPTVWSIHHLQEYNLPRTNNNLEAWHRRFQTVVERFHLGVYSMINEFVKEEHRTNQEVERIIAGIKQVKKKKEQIQREQRLASVLARYGTAPLDDYLRGIAYSLHFGAATLNDRNDSDNEVIVDED